VFENKVLRRVCGPEEEEVTGGWGRLHDKKRHKLYTSSYISSKEIKEDDAWGDEKCMQNFSWKTSREETI
jgi:hypothetical protein